MTTSHKTHAIPPDAQTRAAEFLRKVRELRAARAARTPEPSDAPRGRGHSITVGGSAIVNIGVRK